VSSHSAADKGQIESGSTKKKKKR